MKLPVEVRSTSRGDRVRARLGRVASLPRALAGAPVAWLLLLAGWALLAAGAWVQFGRGWALLVAGALLVVFAATLVDVDRGGH